MSKDYIGPFGPEQIEAGRKARNAAIMTFTWRGLPSDEQRLADEEDRAFLPAAVSTVDRQALVKRLEDVLRTTAAGQSSPRYRLLAEAGIAALFPTEGEAEQ